MTVEWRWVVAPLALAVGVGWVNSADEKTKQERVRACISIQDEASRLSCIQSIGR